MNDLDKQFQAKLDILENRRAELLQEQEIEIARVKERYQTERRKIGSQIGTLKRQKDQLVDYQRVLKYGPLILTDKSPSHFAGPSGKLGMLEFSCTEENENVLIRLLVHTGKANTNDQIECSYSLEIMPQNSYRTDVIKAKSFLLEQPFTKENLLETSLLCFIQEIENCQKYLKSKGL